MIELLITNIVYVAYRLFVTGTIVRLLESKLSYYGAVFIAAQISFLYDTIPFAFLFNANQIPALLDLLVADFYYTARVIAAWWLIDKIRRFTDNFYLSVFVGAEITFVFDYFIFGNMYQ